MGGVQLLASAAQGKMAPRRWYDLEMQSNESEYEEIVQPKREKGAARLTSTERRSRGKCPAKCQRGRQTREQLALWATFPVFRCAMEVRCLLYVALLFCCTYYCVMAAPVGLRSKGSDFCDSAALGWFLPLVSIRCGAS